MNLSDLIDRAEVPAPWDDPGFSERMLKEHLSQDHDAASRRFEKIDAHVDWIHRELLSGQPARIPDLCCGPGLYTSRLAKLGHECEFNEVEFFPSLSGEVDESQGDFLALVAHPVRHCLPTDSVDVCPRSQGGV